MATLRKENLEIDLQKNLLRLDQTLKQRKDRRQRRREVPRFYGDREGDEAWGWLIYLQQFFQMEKIHEEEKLHEAEKGLRGVAFIWYKCWKWLNPKATWKDFERALIEKYLPEICLVDDDAEFDVTKPKPELQTESMLGKSDAKKGEKELEIMEREIVKEETLVVDEEEDGMKKIEILESFHTRVQNAKIVNEDPRELEIEESLQPPEVVVQPPEGVVPPPEAVVQSPEAVVQSPPSLELPDLNDHKGGKSLLRSYGGERLQWRSYKMKEEQIRSRGSLHKLGQVVDIKGLSLFKTFPAQHNDMGLLMSAHQITSNIFSAQLRGLIKPKMPSTSTSNRDKFSLRKIVGISIEGEQTQTPVTGFSAAIEKEIFIYYCFRNRKSHQGSVANPNPVRVAKESWDPGGHYHSLGTCGSLQFKQWDPGGRFGS